MHKFLPFLCFIALFIPLLYDLHLVSCKLAQMSRLATFYIIHNWTQYMGHAVRHSLDMQEFYFYFFIFEK